MASITESFNTANSSTLGPDLTWTETEGDLAVVSNRAQNVTSSFVSARAESPMDTNDQSVTALITAATDPSNLYCGVFLRGHASALTWYEAVAVFNGFGAAVEIIKNIAGSRTLLGTTTIDLTEGVPQRCRFEARGSNLRFLVENIEETRFVEWLRLTDTSITSGKYTGITGKKTPSGDVIWENFAAQDIGLIWEVGSGSQSAGVATTSELASQALAFPDDVEAGSLLIVGGTTWATGGPPAAIVVTDTRSTPYTVLAEAGGTNTKTFIAYGIAPTGGACTVTVNPTGSAYISFGINEFSGVDTSSPLDVDGGVTASSSTNPTANITTIANEALIVGLVDGVASSISPGALYTQIAESEDPTTEAFNLEFKISPNPGGVNAVNWTAAANVAWRIYRASFKPEAAAVEPASTLLMAQILV